MSLSASLIEKYFHRLNGNLLISWKLLPCNIQRIDKQRISFKFSENFFLSNEKVAMKCQPHFKFVVGLLPRAPCKLYFQKIGWETITTYKSLLQHFDTTIQWKGTSGSSNERIWSLGSVHDCSLRLQRKKRIDDLRGKPYPLPAQRRITFNYFHE